MCIVNSDKSCYEVEICNKNNDCICTVRFASITTLCKWLQDFSFDLADCHIYRLKDLQSFDPEVLMYIWKGFNDELRT